MVGEAEEEEGAHQVNRTVELVYTQIDDDPPGGSSDASTSPSDGYAAVETGDPDIGQSQRGGRVITVNGMEFHVFGNVSGLELFEQSGNGSAFPNGSHALDSEEEEEEERKRIEAEKAARDAQDADDLRRSAPLPAEQCKAIVNAMKGVSLGGYQPDWARSIPEEDWLNRLRDSKDLKDGSLQDILRKRS